MVSLHVQSEPDDAFQIKIDVKARLVDITMHGFWCPDDFGRFTDALLKLLPALPANGCAIGEQVTLFDATNFKVQSQNTVGGLAKMAADTSIGSRKVAIILDSVLLKIQAQRTAPDYRVFADRDTAMSWLAEH